jgi:metal-responsive CopG/Arc/MetJ family transcriptional regulator
MFGKFKVKAPKELVGRLKEVAKNHDFKDADDVIDHFISKGLKVYEAPQDEPLKKQFDHVVEEQGYSSRDELIEHLLLRGLRAYEEEAEDPAALEARLRGLGYID